MDGVGLGATGVKTSGLKGSAGKGPRLPLPGGEMMMCGSKARWLDERDSLWLKGGFNTELTEGTEGVKGTCVVGEKDGFRRQQAARS
jgi:hypothetical protein